MLRIETREREPYIGEWPDDRSRSPAHGCTNAGGRWRRTPLSFACLATLLVAANASAQPFVDVGVGSFHLCALDGDGAVACSVDAASTRYDAPSGIGPFVSITAGDAHSCGLGRNGAVGCWGDNDFGQLDVPATERTVVRIDAGVNHSCALTDALTAFCWGDGSAGQTRVPDDVGGDLVAVSAGYLHSCALRSSGQALCWGAGSDEFEQADEIVVPPGSGPFTAIDAGHDFSCGLTSSGEMQCWGASPGELEGAFTELATGERMACGLQADGRVDCVFGEVGNGTTPGVPVTVNEGFPMIGIRSGVRSASCGLGEDGGVRCWGYLEQLPAPGSIDTGTVAVPFDLRVAVYSESLLELLWQNMDESFERRGFEIFRNGEKIALSTNGNSYLDTDVAPGTQYTYRVRVISFRGETGDFSESVTVNTSEQGNFGAEPPYEVPPRPREPIGLRAVVVLGDESVELSWGREAGLSGFGFEIRRDGEFIGFTTDEDFLDDSAEPGARHHYDVIAVDRDGTIAGFRGIDVVVDSTL